MVEIYSGVDSRPSETIFSLQLRSEARLRIVITTSIHSSLRRPVESA
jgi:hypothetical protein